MILQIYQAGFHKILDLSLAKYFPGIIIFSIEKKNASN